MGYLEATLYEISYRFVLLVSLFILPVLSYGQGLHTEANTLPIAGLENIHLVHQEEVTPALYVTPNTIISKSETTVFFVNGQIHETTSMVQIEVATFLETVQNQTAHKLPTAKTPIKAATTDVKQSDNQPVSPAFPWDGKTCDYKKICSSVVVSFGSNGNPIKKDNVKLSDRFTLHSDYTALVIQNKPYLVFCNTIVPSCFGKNVTEFSSRPPPEHLFAKIQIHTLL